MLITLGCPKNEVDSEILAGMLADGGLTLVDSSDEADAILINTCGFIDSAKEESIETILDAVSLKKTSRKSVYVWGCLSERYRGEIEKEIPEVDGYFGVESFEAIGRLLLGPTSRWNDSFYTKRVFPALPHTAYLKIAEGCNHGCHFCAIPLFKGRYRSRTMDSLIAEASSLAEKGVREIILIAQDTTLYGHDLGMKHGLPGLFEELVRIQGIDWIRLMYTHPSHLSNDILDVMAREEKICAYLDMPLQHIADPVLEKMGRRTSRKSIETVLTNVRSRIPNIALRTAFIVGFPGETEEHFTELLDFIEEQRFHRLGVFAYSQEEGTRAYELGPGAPQSVAEERVEILMTEQQAISESNNEALEGSVLDVLIDGYDTEQKLSFGRSRSDAPEVDQTIWVQGQLPAGQIVPVRIESSSTYDLVGRLQQE